MFTSKTVISGGLLFLYNLARGFVPQLDQYVPEDIINPLGSIIMLVFMRMGIGFGPEPEKK